MFLIFLAFYFEIILDLQQNCKNRSDGFCTPFNYLPLMLFFFFPALGLLCGAKSSLVVAHGLCCPAACGNLCFLIRDQTCLPCIGKQILNRGTTREVSIFP